MVIERINWAEGDLLINGYFGAMIDRTYLIS